MKTKKPKAKKVKELKTLKTFKVTPKDWLRIKRNAKEAGFKNISAYIREAALLNVF